MFCKVDFFLPKNRFGRSASRVKVSNPKEAFTIPPASKFSDFRLSFLTDESADSNEVLAKNGPKRFNRSASRAGSTELLNRYFYFCARIKFNLATSPT